MTVVPYDTSFTSLDTGSALGGNCSRLSGPESGAMRALGPVFYLFFCFPSCVCTLVCGLRPQVRFIEGPVGREAFFCLSFLYQQLYSPAFTAMSIGRNSLDFSFLWSRRYLAGRIGLWSGGMKESKYWPPFTILACLCFLVCFLGARFSCWPDTIHQS